MPTDYFILVLGPHLKYSSCLYNSARNTLAEAEHNMLGAFTVMAAAAWIF